MNVIEPQHRVVLVMPKASPDQVHRSQSSILNLLQEETKMIVRVEKLQAIMHMSPNGSLRVNPTGSELWFYCIDPSTDVIVMANHSQINR